MMAIERTASGFATNCQNLPKSDLTQSKFSLLSQRLFISVDASSLATFRILFGLVMCFAMVRFLARGWVKTLYLDPAFHFPWVPFIQPWPGIGMYVHIVTLAICALGIALGCFYRVSIVLFCLGFTYLEFIDRTTYLNHYYLVSLISGLLIFMPAHRQWSIDSWRKTDSSRGLVPVWTIWLLRFQLMVVYIFAGLAKLNADWLFAAQPMRMWLMARSDLPWIGTWLAEPWVAIVASWLGASHDLCIPILLLFARTRPWAYLALVVFHVTTAILFPIGMFPWIMLITTTIFFPPEWPRRMVDRILRMQKKRRFTKTDASLEFVRQGNMSKPLIYLLALYCCLQILIPLRSWLYPQQGAWDVKGFNFAWRVMLVEKTGVTEFYSVNRVTGNHEPISLSQYITPRQEMMMAQDPHLIRALAQYLGYRLPECEIHADAFATLNGHPSQRIVRKDVNLSNPSLENWIVPLQ